MGSVEESDEADGQVPQGGRDQRSVAGAQLVAVFVEDDVPDPVEAVLNAPMAADPGRNGLGPGLIHGKRADQVDHLDLLLALDGAGASDPGSLVRRRGSPPTGGPGRL